MGQIELEIDRPYPKQIEFFKATNKYIAYGGARGGGKSLECKNKSCTTRPYPGLYRYYCQKNIKD